MMKRRTGISELSYEIRAIVAQGTEKFCHSQTVHQNTLTISKALNISRTLASQYLNKMVKAGDLVKIISRPVYYLDKKIIENHFHITLRAQTYEGIEELTRLFDKRLVSNKSFMAAVGYDTTLHYIITQCKAAVRYPPNGVPLLLCGEHGVGKTFFAKLIYEYAKEDGIIPKRANCLWMHYSVISENKFCDEDVLFGHVANKDGGTRVSGLLEQADGGFVIIENIEKMSVRCMEKLAVYIQYGTYTAMDETASRHSQARLIFTTTQRPADCIESALLHLIPVVCRLPSLEARPVRDKEQLMQRYLNEEGVRIGRSIKISRQCYECILNTPFPNNISGLAGVIKILCTNAFLTQQANEHELRLLMYNMPEDMLGSAQYTDGASGAEEEILDLSEYRMQQSFDFTLNFFDYLLNAYDNYRQGHVDQKGFTQQCAQSMNLYYDYIIFERQYANERIRSLEKVVEKIFDEVIEAYDIYIPGNCVFVITRMLYWEIEANAEIRDWTDVHRAQITALFACLAQMFPEEARAAGEVFVRIHNALDVKIEQVEHIFLMINLQFYNRTMHAPNCTALIITHGYSTASSMADVANHMLGSCVFKAIDMPLTADIKDTLSAIRRFLKNSRIGETFLLMVDMGSLETITEQLGEIPNVKIGVINNVSTRAALYVGSKLLDGVDMETILKSASAEITNTWRVVGQTNKPDAVVFALAGGMSLTERVIQLFRSSLPDSMNVKLVPCDCARLACTRDSDELFSQYRVLFVVSTEPLKVSLAPVVLLEDIIVTEDCVMSGIIAKHFSKQETEAFQSNLLKNFSLENIVRHLTILDADKLLNYVADALERLQQMMNVRLKNNTVVGLYIHISNMVEQLVTNAYCRVPAQDAALSPQEKRFMRLFSTAFEEISMHYNIEIPQQEVRYVFSYVEQDIQP